MHKNDVLCLIRPLFAGQSHEHHLSPSSSARIGIGGGGDESPGFDAAFAFDRVQSDEIEGDVSEHGQVVSRCLGTSTHLVVVEGHIHAPVQAVLDGPVRTDGVGNAMGVGSQTADVEALFTGSLVADGALGFEHGETAQSLPLAGLM
jgi:hypothetical protein